jgi:hypothetical protein
MRHLRPNAPLALVGAVVATLYGCQQSDQELPFGLDPSAGQTVTVNASGGTVSVPPSFSIEFPPGSLTGSELVTAQQRSTAFPGDAGVVLPGTAFDVGPAGTALAPTLPARVQIGVPSALLGAGDDLSLQVALLQPGGAVITDVTSYDIVNGILTADVYEIGPVAAVVSNDVSPVGDIADVPTLGGGAVTPAPPAVAGPAAAPVHSGGVVFTGDCSPGERSCFTSGIARLWVDDTVRDRLGDEIVLINTTVEASIEFFSFDPLNSVPDSAQGYVRIEGDFRARINSVVANREVGEEVALYTGQGSDPFNPDATAITMSGNEMTFESTSLDEDPETVFFDISGVGTSELLTIELDGTLEFSNADGSTTEGAVVAHVRLRR